MRTPVRSALRLATLASLLLTAAPSFAQDESTKPAAPPTAPPAAPPAAPAQPAPDPASEPAPAVLPPSAPPSNADRPATGDSEEGPTRPSEGIRLGLDLGFQRAFSGAEDRLNAGSPSLIPLGVDISWHTSPKLVFGFHGYAALASRDDCIEADSCRARGYGFGGHVETTLGSGRKFVPWLRYGVGYELLYQGGAPFDSAGHVYRGAIDLLDLRIGGDIVIKRDAEGKTTAIAPFAGFTGGFLVNQSGVSNLNGSGGQQQNLDRSSGSAHLWFVLGMRATLDP
jgi:hypothetical protein